MWDDESDTPISAGEAKDLDLKDVYFSDIEDNKEYYVAWVSGFIRDRRKLNVGDKVRVFKVADAMSASGMINITPISTIGPSDGESFDLTYLNITLGLPKNKVQEAFKCSCSIRTVTWQGCQCGAFKKGDK